MAYNRGNRFPSLPKCYNLLEPGAYQRDLNLSVKPNKVPFLSKLPRNSAPRGVLWTHAIYDTNVQPHIPNCTTFKSNIPRFPYETFSIEDLETLLCRCGIQSPCECPTKTGEEENQTGGVTCQGKVHKQIFIGLTPRSAVGEGLSVPSRHDHGFEILPNGNKKRLLDKVEDTSPPFYDAQVHESTAFYHGCKWCKWTSKRTSSTPESGPGPADYHYVKQPTLDEICVGKFRLSRRKQSKQLRFIEMVQQRNIKESLPGPGAYSPELPKGYEMQLLGPKAKRFLTSTNKQWPSPVDHWIKRTFDLSEPPEVPCQAKLPEPSFFGVNAMRFKHRHEEGPSPASYNPVDKFCHIVHCPTAPFGSSSVRFKNLPLEDDNDDEEIITQDETVKQIECPKPSWEFKSKTVRMKPLTKIGNEPSPADVPQSKIEIHRDKDLQYSAPFFASEGRFQPWNDWMPVHGRVNTPGPCNYNLEKPKCLSAVPHGPVFRSPRFPLSYNHNPSPNKYRIGGGVETILKTHNHKLKENIENQHKFIWVPPAEPKTLSFEEQEALLLSKSIALLDDNPYEERIINTPSKEMIAVSTDNDEIRDTKLLRCFVYGQQTPHCT